MVPTLDVPTPLHVAALAYPTLDELLTLLPDTSETRRFLAKVDVGPVPAHAPHLGPCLLWKPRPNSRGYGAFRTGRESLYPGEPRTVSPHKWLDFFLNGRTPVPPGFELDHICHDPNLCTMPAHRCPHRPCVIHTQRKTLRENRLRALHAHGINAAKIRCDGEFAPADPVTGEKIGHLLTDENGKDTENVYRPPKNPQERKCRPCQVERAARWNRKATLLKAEARARGLRESGHLELISG